ncbi:MAG: bifunctional 4-hydroxy-2-oxoglutarate aldolase/2-dehydro-3-deoxy-phosphogluconate aldolase [Gammaproteobacteria bacterium]|nr:bifunctional 4-hydroxy-2-oxoglutarate aldolase/2-dehydro-3-deoxy-phosphogluconate aldolase [Gammaproteobacteria bacterium]
MTLDEILALARPVMPVLVIAKLEQAMPLAEALAGGGVHVLEITLRSDAALDAIRLLSRALPNAVIGAGTVLSEAQMDEALDAGARFLVSPGATPRLLEAAAKRKAPLLPGVATASEVQQALEYGYERLKCFPAAAAGGPALLKALAGPFPGVRFCPTGGITEATAPDYLALPNVVCVGGSWLATPEQLERGDWAGITAAASRSRQLGSRRLAG